MPLNVLIAPDKFKGSLTALEASRAIACGWRRARPKDRLTLLPITDGGDGFGPVMANLFGATSVRTRTVDAAHRPCMALWWWHENSKTAIIESANEIGLAMLPAGRFHPFELDTFGLGRLLQAATQRGARRVLIGLGGSATNDGGFGLARALGWRFLDRAGHSVEHWTELDRLHTIQRPAPFRLPEIRAAVDVQNRLLGPRGATRVYGPQKGLKPEELTEAESKLRKLAQRSPDPRQANQTGSGAAGGLGFGLRNFANARLEPGFDLFARTARLQALLRNADLVVTGEGRLDLSTLMGKGVGELATRCRVRNLPCIALAGHAEAGKSLCRAFAQIASLTDLTTRKQALACPAVWLEKLARRIAAGFPGEDEP